MYIKKIVFDWKEESKNLDKKEFDFTSTDATKITTAKFVILIGKNGSGKTTLLTLLEEVILSFENQYIKNKLDYKINLKLGDAAEKIKEFKESFVIQANKKINMDNEIGKMKNKILFFFEDFVCIFQKNRQNNKKQHLFLTDKFYINEFVEYLLSLKIELVTKNHNVASETEDVKNNILTLRNEWKTMIFTRDIILKALDKTVDDRKKSELSAVVLLYSKYYFYNDILKRYFKFELPNNDNDFIYFAENRNFFVSKITTNDNSPKNTLAIKQSDRIYFDKLSSGEKHIFSILLKLLFTNKNCICLFDELENSLCPNQQHIVSKIIIETSQNMENNQIKQQFFITTHSPFVLKNFLNRKDTVIINSENAKNIKKDKKLLLNRDKMISYDEIIYLYYDITTSSYYISLYETMKRKFKENIGNKLLIASKLSCLYDGTSTDWDSFMEKFKDENWRNDQKNKPIIEQLCNLLSCQPDETHDKINGLSNKIKSYATILRNEKHNTTCGSNALKKMTDDGLCFFLLHINFEVLKNKIYRVACIESSDKLNKMRNSNQTKIKHKNLLCLDNLTLLRNLLAHSDNELNWNIKISKNEQNNQIFENLEETKLFYASFENNFEKLLKEQIETIRTILINWEKIAE